MRIVVKNIEGIVVPISGSFKIRPFKMSFFKGMSGAYDQEGNFIGFLHSDSKAAIENDDGTCRWFLDGIEYSKVQWLNKLGK